MIELFSTHPTAAVVVVLASLAGLGVTWFVFSSFWASATYKPFLRSEPEVTATRTSEGSSPSDGGNASGRPSSTRAHDVDRDDQEIENTGPDSFESRYSEPR